MKELTLKDYNAENTKKLLDACDENINILKIHRCDIKVLDLRKFKDLTTLVLRSDEVSDIIINRENKITNVDLSVNSSKNLLNGCKNIKTLYISFHDKYNDNILNEIIKTNKDLEFLYVTGEHHIHEVKGLNKLNNIKEINFLLFNQIDYIEGFNSLLKRNVKFSFGFNNEFEEEIKNKLLAAERKKKLELI